LSVSQIEKPNSRVSGISSNLASFHLIQMGTDDVQ
jgi:hypothetical protein